MHIVNACVKNPPKYFIVSYFNIEVKNPRLSKFMQSNKNNLEFHVMFYFTICCKITLELKQVILKLLNTQELHMMKFIQILFIKINNKYMCEYKTIHTFPIFGR